MNHSCSYMIVMWESSEISFIITFSIKNNNWNWVLQNKLNIQVPTSDVDYFQCVSGVIVWAFGCETLKIQLLCSKDFCALQWSDDMFLISGWSIPLKQRHVYSVKMNIVWCVQWNQFLQLNPWKAPLCLNCQLSLLERQVVKIFSKVCWFKSLFYALDLKLSGPPFEAKC